MARRKKIVIRLPAASAIEDCWQRQAMTVAIERARAAISGGAVPPNTPVGRLSDVELGWIAAGIIFGWVSTRATQAAANGFGAEELIHSTGLDPDPWVTGAIAAALPELAEAKVDWNASLADLSRDEMVAFLGDAFTLINKSIKARDLGEKLITRKPPRGAASDGQPWNDPIPEFEKLID
jgi:hypothetical protein